MARRGRVGAGWQNLIRKRTAIDPHAPLTHLSLFSGIGGLDLAAEAAGFRTVAFCESDRFCRSVLEKHWPGVPVHPDVRGLDGSLYAGVDLVTGGFPCQPFSTAGKRRGKEDDRFLWPEMLRVIAQARPAFAVGENVAGIVPLALDDVLASLEGLGYAARPFMVPACGVGALHKRDRVFVVAADPARLAAVVRPLEPSGRAGGKGSLGQAEDRDGRRAGLLRGAGADGAAGALAGRELPAWESEPRVGRVADGVPRRLDRLKSLGNAVVPRQAYPVLLAVAREIRKVPNRMQRYVSAVLS